EAVCQGTRLSKDLRNLLYAPNLELQGRMMLEEFSPELIYVRHCLFSTAGLGLARHFGIPLLVELNAPMIIEQDRMRGLSLPLLGAAASAFRLLLVGSGPELRALRTQAETFGLAEAVHMTGAVPHHAVPDFLRSADLTVAPYAAEAADYFSPVKLFEYMAMARPIVAARIGQAAEVIED